MKKVIAILIAFSGLALPAHAGTLFSTGFESPTYSLGALSGQDGWDFFGSGTAVVQDAVVHSGSQAAEITAASAQTGPMRLFPAPSANSLITMTADIYLQSSSRQTAWQFGAYNGFGGINVLADGSVQLITTGLPVVSSLVSRDAWNQYELDYDLQSSTFDFLLNGTSIASNLAFPGPISYYSGTSYLTTVNSFGGGDANDAAFVDDLSITANPVPEPGSLALLLPAAGSFLLLRRRRFLAGN